MAANSECLPSTDQKDNNLSNLECTNIENDPSTSECFPEPFVFKAYETGKKLPIRTVRDPMLIERCNLVNISKLVVKELIETSQKYGRMLDSDHLTLQHFFIVLEHVLRHGLKPKKGILGPKKELWDILQLVEKYSADAIDTTASVRDLPTVTTAMGRARAWLRLALMQKKLADYLKVLVDRKEEVLAEYFQPDALLMSDEAFIIIGLLVGLNVIDCNLCVKGEDLDCQQGMINFSLYLRSSHNYYQPVESILDPDNMTTVLDQKNYIEELNRHLNATVSNLESKVETLQTTNALMKEDLDIARKSLSLITEENNRLRRGDMRIVPNPADQVGGKQEVKQVKAELEQVKNEVAADMQTLRTELEAEKKKRLEVEKELKLQISMKSEMEVAMKLLEKDIHEKQGTIVSLQKQLDEIKLINLEMFKKLQECEEDLTQKGELVSRLQKKTSQIGKILNNMEKYNVIKDLERGPVRSASLAQEGGSRPTSWAQSPTTVDIFDKKSPMYYKKVDPLTNIDFSKILPGDFKKTPISEESPGPPLTKQEKKEGGRCASIDE